MLASIRLYWLGCPPAWRRQCLFEESCSRYVYRQTSLGGLRLGLRALRARYQQGRPGYFLEVRSGRVRLRLRDGSVMRYEEAAHWLRARLRYVS
ncbi:MAG: hypothetical protein KDD47_28470 [Acidobacteria bacterium]|nr:hypothetical protein [Acidobacteriota bacterium]